MAKRNAKEMEDWNRFFAAMEESLPLAGMESAGKDRKQAREIAEGQELTAELVKPLGDISKKSGRIEREAPLFYGTGANPTLFNQE